MTQSMFLIGLVLRQPTACLWLCESRWLTFLAHILCAQGTAARSSLSSYCESDNWPKCHAIHSLVFSSAPPITTLDLLLEDYMPEIPRSLYVTVHSPTSACQTPSSNTGNFLHCFQISGAVESVAFLVISLADFSTLRVPAYILPSILAENIQISICHAEIFDSTQILRQTKSIVFHPLLTVSRS